MDFKSNQRGWLAKAKTLAIQAERTVNRLAAKSLRRRLVVGAVIGALGIYGRSQLNGFAETHYLVPLTAVFLAVLIAGVAAGMMALGLSLLWQLYFVWLPNGLLHLNALSKPNQVYAGLYALVALSVVGLVALLRASRREMERRQSIFETLIGNSTDGIIVMQPDGHIDFATQTAAQILGYPLQQLVGLNGFELDLEPNTEADEDGMARLLDTPGAQIFSVRKVKRGDGSEIWTESVGTNMISDPNIGGIIVNFRDVTARKKVQDQLVKSRALLQAILENVNEGVSVQDDQGRVLYANELGAKVSGLPSADEMEGMDVERFHDKFEVYNEAGQMMDWQDLPNRQVISGKHGSAEALVRYREKDSGTERWSFIKSSAIAADDGSQMVVNSFRDVSAEQVEQKKLELVAKITKTLTSSLNYQLTLERLAQLVVEDMADWCSVMLVDEAGKQEMLKIADRDPANKKLAEQMQKQFKTGGSPSFGIGKTILEGQPQLISQITEDLIDQSVTDAKHAEILKKIGMSSVIIVPLTTPERNIGAISLVRTTNKNPFTQDDLRLAVNLAERASVAIENAGLYEASLRIREQLEEAVIRSSQELQHEKTFTESLISSSADGIAAVDAELNFTVWNPAIAKLTGIPAEKVLGKNAAAAIPDFGKDPEFQNIKQVLKTGQPISSRDQAFRLDTAKEGFYDAHYSAINSNDGSKVVGVLIVVHDTTERHLAEKAVRESQQTLKNAQRIAQIGSWEWDIKADKISWSEELFKIFGVKQHDFKGDFSSYASLVHPEDVESVKQRIDKALQDGQPFEFQHRIVRPDGSTRFIHSQGRTIKAGDKLVKLEGTAQDITERKLAEDILRQSEERFRALSETANDAIISADSNGTILYFNSAAERIFGRKTSEALGKPLNDLFPKRYFDPKASGIDRFFPSSETHLVGNSLELSGLRSNGEEFPAEVSVAQWAAASTNNYTLIVRDISERQEIEERFKLLVEGVVDYSIIMLDPAGKVVSWNKGAERINGYRANEIIGQDLGVFYPDDERQAGKPARELKIAQERGRYSEDGWRVRKDGSRYYASVTTTALHDPSGKLRGFSKVTRDITERRRLDQMKSDFVSLVSHQLKTPVALVRGYVENMLSGISGDLNERQRAYLEDIQDISAKNYSLISDLLNISRLERGVISFDIRPVKLQDIIHLSLRTHEPRVKHKDLRLNLNQPEREIMVLADKFKMSEAVSNVVDNAIKFTDKGAITISSGTTGEQAWVEIADTGKGMNRELLQKIFKRDQIFGGAPTPEGGSGLGLYISHQFMEMQGGFIAVESKPGQGSKFTFRIPLAKVKEESKVTASGRSTKNPDSR